jgi:hypothetical protein
LKLRSLRKGLPAVQNFGEAPKTTEIQVGADEAQEETKAREGVDEVENEEKVDGAETMDGDDEIHAEEGSANETSRRKTIVKPPTQDEFLWVWKVRLFLWYFIPGDRNNKTRNLISPSWRPHGGHSFCRYLVQEMRIYCSLCVEVIYPRFKNIATNW